MCSKNNLMATKYESHLGIKALASSAVSGHRLAKHASSNLWSFFLPSKLQLQEINASKKRSLFIHKILAWKNFPRKLTMTMTIFSDAPLSVTTHGENY